MQAYEKSTRENRKLNIKLVQPTDYIACQSETWLSESQLFKPVQSTYLSLCTMLLQLIHYYFRICSCKFSLLL